jgi:ATP-dependent helicase HrpA
MAAELVETSRLWGRMAARIEPEWVEPLAGHLVRRSYSEPHWSRRSAAALAAEKVTLYGVPIVTARPVNYSAIDPPLCRELFIRHALVEGDWDTKHAFLAANQRLLADVEELEHRARRRDILVDDQTMVDFYDARIPPDVVSGRHFDAWWKRARASTPDLLTFDVALLVAAGAKGVDERDFPDTWQVGPDTAADLGSNPASGTATGTATGTASSATTAADRPHAHSLTMTYQFEPGSAADGVTVHVPLAILNQIPAEGFDWQVPGLREELVTALIRSLPKALRRSYVPAPNYARTVLDRVGPADGPILAVLERELNRIGGGTTVARSDWSLDRVPPHLRITFRVYEGTRTLGEGKDLDDLKRRLAPKLTAAVSAAGGGLERTGLTGWGDLGTVPRSVERRAGGLAVRGFPALVAQPTGVALRILATPADQAAAHPVGTRALVLASVASPARFVNGQLSNTSKLALRHHPHASVGALLDDCVAAAADALIDAAGGPVWDAAGFERLRDAVRAELPERSLAVVRAVERVLTLAHDVESRVDGLADRARANPALAASLADLRGQLAELVYPGFVTATGADRLDDLARYLTGAGRRLDRLPAEAAREQPGLAKVARVRSAYAELLTELLAPGCAPGPDLRRIRWMIEELRISLFAQTLRTPYAVSEERIYRAMDDVAA